jgi:hypothetical protein
MVQLFPKHPKTSINIDDLVSIAKKDFSKLLQKKTQIMDVSNAVLEANLAFTNFFLSDEVEGEKIVFIIENRETTAQSFNLFTGIDYYDPASTISDNDAYFVSKERQALIVNGTAPADLPKTSVTSLTPGLTIDDVVNYIRTRNIELRRIRITTSNAQQYNQPLAIKRFDPIKREKEQLHRFSDALQVNVPDQRSYELPGSVLLTTDTALQYSLLGASEANPNTVTVEIELGIQSNPNALFKNLLGLYGASLTDLGRDPRNTKISGLDNRVAALQKSPMALPTAYGQ